MPSLLPSQLAVVRPGKVRRAAGLRLPQVHTHVSTRALVSVAVVRDALINGVTALGAPRRRNFAFFQTNERGDLWGTDSWADPNLLFGPYDW